LAPLLPLFFSVDKSWLQKVLFFFLFIAHIVKKKHKKAKLVVAETGEKKSFILEMDYPGNKKKKKKRKKRARMDEMVSSAPEQYRERERHHDPGSSSRGTGAGAAPVRGAASTSLVTESTRSVLIALFSEFVGRDRGHHPLVADIEYTQMSNAQMSRESTDPKERTMKTTVTSFNFEVGDALSTLFLFLLNRLPFCCVSLQRLVTIIDGSMRGKIFQDTRHTFSSCLTQMTVSEGAELIKELCIGALQVMDKVAAQRNAHTWVFQISAVSCVPLANEESDSTQYLMATHKANVQCLGCYTETLSYIVLTFSREQTLYASAGMYVLCLILQRYTVKDVAKALVAANASINSVEIKEICRFLKKADVITAVEDQGFELYDKITLTNPKTLLLTLDQ
jgi:hypothetical protein